MVSMAIASMWASMAAWFTPTVLFCATNLIIATIFIASNTTTNNPSHERHNPPTQISRVSSFLDRARSFKLPSYSTTTTVTTAESHYQYPSEPKTATYSSTGPLAQSIHFSSNYVADPVPPEITHSHELYPSEPETHPLSQPTSSPSLFERVKSIKFTSDSPVQLARPPSFLDRVKSFKISFDMGADSTQLETLDSDPGHNHPEHHVIRSKSEKTTVKKKKISGDMKKSKISGDMKKSRSEMRMVADDDDDGEGVELRRPAMARVRGNHDVDAKADDFISRFKQQLKLQRIESMVRYNQMLKRSS